MLIRIGAHTNTQAQRLTHVHVSNICFSVIVCVYTRTHMHMRSRVYVFVCEELCILLLVEIRKIKG